MKPHTYTHTKGSVKSIILIEPNNITKVLTTARKQKLYLTCLYTRSDKKVSTFLQKKNKERKKRKVAYPLS